MARLLLILLIVSFSAAPSAAQTCSTTDLSTKSNQVFAVCNALPTLSSYLYWNYDTSTGTAHVAFRKAVASAGNWVAWGLNPSGKVMAGLQAIVAFQHSNGTMLVYTSPVSGHATVLAAGDVSFPVSNLSVVKLVNDIVVFATLKLSDTFVSTNHLWQEGPVSEDVPQMHAIDSAHLGSTGTIDFRSGLTTVGGDPDLHKKNVHGVLNAVSWGTMMPMGAMMARYLKVFKSANPAWFYLHVGTQFSAYAIGVGGWATGMALGNDASGKLGTHRDIGITLFVLGTLQVFALLLRPKPDHKYRRYWNFYHHGIGYSTIILSVVNVYKGLNILDPEKKWKKAYTGVIIFLGAVAVALEAVTWAIVMKRKASASDSNSYNKNANGLQSRPHGGA